MTASATSSLLNLAEELLDHWERFLQAEHTLHGLPEQGIDSPVFETMAHAEMAVGDLVAWAQEQGVVVELSQACLQAVERRDWTLPMLIRLNLLVAREILDYPLALDEQTAVRWEICVIPATGRREDLHRFATPEATKALNDHGFAPPNGQAVVLGVSTPDELMAWLSDHDQVLAWRQRCEAAQDHLPVTEGLPLLTLEAGRDEEAHFGAFVYVVGMVERFDPHGLPTGSPIQNTDFEDVETQWEALKAQWDDRLPATLAIVEPDEVWDGCVYAVGGALLQTIYLQHAIGGTPMAEGEGPVFAVVVDEEKDSFRAAGVFPDGEVIFVPLDVDMVAFLPALLDSPEFEFVVVEESDFHAWVGEVRGEQAPEPPARPRRLS